jgi:hypothetical protein
MTSLWTHYRAPFKLELGVVAHLLLLRYDCSVVVVVFVVVAAAVTSLRCPSLCHCGDAGVVRACVLAVR